VKPIGEEQIVDAQWLFERGDLHDARVVKLTQSRDDLCIFIKNQWSNFDRLEHPPEGGALIVRDAQKEPRIDPKSLEERMSEVQLVSAESGLVLTMIAFGQHVIEAKGSGVVWRGFEFNDI